MPAVATHYAFADKFAREKPRAFADAMYLGAQGPDPLFLYGIRFPKRKNPKPIQNFGTGLHHTDIAPIYKYFFEYANQSERKELLYSYIEGLFLHYVVDRNCHPYIFVKSGCPIEGLEEDIKWGGYHANFEGWIDFLVAKEYGIHRNNTPRYMDIDKEELRAISAMWDYVNKKTWDSDGFNPDSFRLAVKDYRYVLRLCNRPHYFSGWWIRAILGKWSIPYGLHMQSKMRKEFADLDFLNLKHAPWPDFATGEMHTESFYDLFDKAVADYKEAVAIIDAAKSGENIDERLSAFVGKKDHDGAVDGAPKRFRDPIWPEMESYRILP